MSKREMCRQIPGLDGIFEELRIWFWGFDRFSPIYNYYVLKWSFISFNSDNSRWGPWKIIFLKFSLNFSHTDETWMKDGNEWCTSVTLDWPEILTNQTWVAFKPEWNLNPNSQSNSFISGTWVHPRWEKIIVLSLI